MKRLALTWFIVSLFPPSPPVSAYTIFRTSRIFRYWDSMPCSAIRRYNVSSDLDRIVRVFLGASSLRFSPRRRHQFDHPVIEKPIGQRPANFSARSHVGYPTLTDKVRVAQVVLEARDRAGTRGSPAGLGQRGPLACG